METIKPKKIKKKRCENRKGTETERGAVFEKQ